MLKCETNCAYLYGDLHGLDVYLQDKLLRRSKHILFKCLNPCAAKTKYIWFQANFRINKIPLKFVTYITVDGQLIKYSIWEMAIFYKWQFIHSFCVKNCVSNSSSKSMKNTHKQFSSTRVSTRVNPRATGTVYIYTFSGMFIELK